MFSEHIGLVSAFLGTRRIYLGSLLRIYQGLPAWSGMSSTPEPQDEDGVQSCNPCHSGDKLRNFDSFCSPSASTPSIEAEILHCQLERYFVTARRASGRTGNGSRPAVFLAGCFKRTGRVVMTYPHRAKQMLVIVSFQCRQCLSINYR